MVVPLDPELGELSLSWEEGLGLVYLIKVVFHHMRHVLDNIGQRLTTSVLISEVIETDRPILVALKIINDFILETLFIACLLLAFTLHPRNAGEEVEPIQELDLPHIGHRATRLVSHLLLLDEPAVNQRSVILPFVFDKSKRNSVFLLENEESF